MLSFVSTGTQRRSSATAAAADGRGRRAAPRRPISFWAGLGSSARGSRPLPRYEAVPKGLRRLQGVFPIDSTSKRQ